MIEMMQNESDFDFRNIVFIVPSYEKDTPNNEDTDDSDSDDDTGGGDNGMTTDSGSSYGEEENDEPDDGIQRHYSYKGMWNKGVREGFGIESMCIDKLIE